MRCERSSTSHSAKTGQRRPRRSPRPSTPPSGISKKSCARWPGRASSTPSEAPAVGSHSRRSPPPSASWTCFSQQKAIFLASNGAHWASRGTPASARCTACSTNRSPVFARRSRPLRSRISLPMRTRPQAYAPSKRPNHPQSKGKRLGAALNRISPHHDMFSAHQSVFFSSHSGFVHALHYKWAAWYS